MIVGSFTVDGAETDGPEDWRKGLADPKKQWKQGKSAKALAYCWEESNGFPPDVQRIFERSNSRQLMGLRFLRGFIEHTTSVPGRGRASQADILVKAEGQSGVVMVAVEGKVDEHFDEEVSVWLGPRPSKNKQHRLIGLCNMREVAASSVGHIRYQLLHRTASALIEARNVGASCAVMLVHSFSQEDEHFKDYQTFLSLLGASGKVNSVTHIGKKAKIDLYLAWVRGNPRFLTV